MKLEPSFDIAWKISICMNQSKESVSDFVNFGSFSIFSFTFQAKVRSAALKLEQQIILADCQVLAAILNFINQVLPTTAVRMDKTLKKTGNG